MQRAPDDDGNGDDGAEKARHFALYCRVGG
jgi:hypothetical protein